MIGTPPRMTLLVVVVVVVVVVVDVVDVGADDPKWNRVLPPAVLVAVTLAGLPHAQSASSTVAPVA